MNQPETDSSASTNQKTDQDRQILQEAQARGLGPTLGAWCRLSGPGWLQSAITLGGGSLGSALFLGILGGVSMLWLQLVAIVLGVIMLSAISYVTLSTGERPFQAINRHVNPALGWGWLTATCMANIIWCMPQFALCYEALDKNLLREVGGLESTVAVASAEGAASAPAAPKSRFTTTRFGISFAMLVVAAIVVGLNARRGWPAMLFDLMLKGLVGMVVLCFFGVVVYLTMKGQLDWGKIFAGFVPDFNQWRLPAGDLREMLKTVPDEAREFWSSRLVAAQTDVMIAAAATAVGINMTFLMPYSMLHRGWDKTFRGLARFDLSTGMAIPYVLVTSCVVIAAAHVFHATADPAFLSKDPAEMMKSPIYQPARDNLHARFGVSKEQFAKLTADERSELEVKIAALPDAEKKAAASLVKRNAFQLSKAIGPIVGNDRVANYMFGLGVFGMCFSTIIILMLINGFAFCEMLNRPNSGMIYAIGCLTAGICGSFWFMVWEGEAKAWLVILASTFGAMLLPIAYLTFFMMMNSKSLMGEEKPTGWRMIVWNVLMSIAVIGALAAAGQAIYGKLHNDPRAAAIVLPLAGVYIVLVIAGFLLKKKSVPNAA